MRRWLALLLVVLAACSSSRSASPLVNAGVAPTVFNCGGGAYKPATLLVVCGIGSTMVTSVTWTSWSSSGASGAGVVHVGSSSGRARLSLSHPVDTPQGPQFSILSATYTGPSPDGHPSDQFTLGVASASNP